MSSQHVRPHFSENAAVLMSEGNYKAGNAHIVCVRTRNPWYNMYTTMQAGVRMSSELNISERFVNELVNYCSSNHGISQVILFGSRARGDFHPNSDIDLAIRTKIHPILSKT